MTYDETLETFNKTTFMCRCECVDLLCRRKFHITIGEHDSASAKGDVRHVDCVYPGVDGDYEEVERHENYAIWRKKNE